VVDAGHRAGLEVHAWINAMPIWRDEPPPRDPAHVFNRHGPSASAQDCWLTQAREGRQKFPVGYFLDPGHPAARDHLVRVYLDIARRYDVDGIHFDYIRYPETEERLPRGADVGYNPVSLARFQRARGRADLPAPDDEAWTAWRREQVTSLVRRISLEARALKRRLKVSAATIAWGRPPRSRADFAEAAPMQRVFQDWRSWLEEGLLDLAVPMNYAREHDAVVRGWFDGWIAWEKRNKSGRHLAVGVGGYLSAPEAVLAQVVRARAPAGGRRADGVSIYSYFRPSGGSSVASVAPPDAAPSPDRLDFLAGAFSGPAPVPAMAWLLRPRRGFLAGSALGPSGTPADGAAVLVRRHGLFRRTRRLAADANGWFGTTGLDPGRYRVRIGSDEAHVEVRAGELARVVFARP
jgi:hypothetical protein